MKLVSKTFENDHWDSSRGSVTRTATSREAELIMIASTVYHRSPWQVGCNCHTETDTNSGGEDAHGDSNQDGMNKIVEEIIK